MSAAVTLRGPETIRQAERFEVVKNNAIRLGHLCYRCACQFAYGTQHGFYAVEAPCDDCTLTMAWWPLPEGNGWRRPGKGSTEQRAAWERLLPPPEDRPLSEDPAIVLRSQNARTEQVVA